MVDIPFQAGQRFELEQAAGEQALLERQRREEGINALAGMFGPTALAPVERAAITGGERAERRLTAAEEQRALANERQAIIDQRTAEEADLKRRTGAALNLVGFFEQGVKNNVPFELLAQRAGPTMQALGIPDEETSAIIQRISEDPATVLPQIRASLTAGQPRQPGQAGRLTPAVVGGKDVFIRGLPGGGIETIEGATPITPELQRRRLAGAEERTRIQALKVEPEAVNRLAGAKKAGELTATRVTDGLETAREAVVSVETADRALELIEDGIRTGSLAGARQEASRFFADILGLKGDQIATTDEFFAIRGVEVASQIKAFGAGTGLSDADRDFAEGIVGGRRDVDIRAIKRLVEMRRKISVKTIKNYNRDRNAFVKGSERLSLDFPVLGVPRKVREKTTRRFVFKPATGRLEPK